MEIAPGSKSFRFQSSQLSNYYKVGSPLPTPVSGICEFYTHNKDR